ncbi:amidohydrolase family protein [Candidatus Woesearchaeota archaeon]|nr:amidohydrolase family protein [Candidatus Woesearchaeota archaeon]
MEIIDVHSHLGDILNPNGGRIITQKGLPDRNLFDTGFKIRNLWDAGFYAALIHYGHSGKQPPYLVREWGTYSNRQRNAVATVENLQRSLDASGVTHTCCLPIPPHVTCEDILCAGDKRIIPFTGVDFTTHYDIESTLAGHVKDGAKGMKLHPIVQKVALSDRRLREAVELFSRYGLPILFHSGVTSYYHGEEKRRQEPRYGNITDAEQLVADFPAVNFIIGHAGGIEVHQVIATLPQYENAYVDTSFQSPEKIRELVNAFGSERVLFASDWPYGDRKASIKMVKLACKSDEGLEQKLFYWNAAHLLGLR